MGDVVLSDNGDGVFTGREPHTSHKLMAWHNLVRKMFKAAETEKSLPNDEWEKRIKALNDLANDPSNEELLTRFVDMWQDEISKKVVAMRRFWDEGRRRFPNLTMEQFWEYHEQRADKMLAEGGMSDEDAVDKFAISAMKLVDRTAWSFLKNQLMREAGVM